MEITFRTRYKALGDKVLLPAAKIIKGTNYIVFTEAEKSEKGDKTTFFVDIKGEKISEKKIYRFTGEKVFVMCDTIDNPEMNGLYFAVPKSFLMEYRE